MCSLHLITLATRHSCGSRGQSRMYNVGILTISDSAYKDASKDRSGPLIAEQLKQEQSNNVVLQVIRQSTVPDDIDAIRLTLQNWIDAEQNVKEVDIAQKHPGGLDLVLCTGGTGFGVRDVTPEAVASLFTKQTSGLTHALVQHSLTKTPHAALSRMVTGIRKHCLIITLPGSPKAVRECFEVLLGPQGVLLHALDLITGGSGEAQHKEMQKNEHGARSGIKGTETDTGASHRSDGHHHHHHHHHHQGNAHGAGHQAPIPRTAQQDNDGYVSHDPTKSVTLRHRTSPYPIISVDEAMHSILTIASVNEAITLPVNSALRGYLLAQSVYAPRSLPPKPTTNVDGYAVKASETPPGAYPVVLRGGVLPPKSVYRINTGQGLPDGADAVLMVEDSDLLQEQDGEEKEITVKAQIDAGENVRQAGSDVRQGQLILEKGVKVGDIGGEIGTLAFLGQKSVQVTRKPKIALLSTGNELYDVDKDSSHEQNQDAWGFRVFDANRPSLSASLQGAGFDVLDLGIVGDSVEQTLKALKRGVEEADVVISTGGTSMGESDLLKPLIERNLNDGKIHFGRVAMKPGKPTTFATATSTQGQQRLLFALPGNPASAMVCLYVFVMPALRKLSGCALEHCQIARTRVRLQDELRCDPRPEYHRVVVSVDMQGGLQARSTGSQRSSGMHSMATANGLVCVPARTVNGPSSLPKGSYADVMLLGSLN